MKKFLFPLVLLSAASIFIVSQYYFARPAKFSEIKADKLFSIEVADYLTKTDSLSPNASLQYRNKDKGIFLLVISESKDTMQHYGYAYSLLKYFHAVTDELKAKLNPGVLGNFFETKINGQKAMLGSVKGTANGTEVYYRLAIVETRSHFYQVLAGIVAEEKSRYEEEMDRMINSFREL